MTFLVERTGQEYEVALSKLPLGIFGNSEFEVLQDKSHHTLVYPRSINDKGHFRLFSYSKRSLNQLDVGFSPDGTGTQVVGTMDNFVNRKFVDAFVGCMGDVYKLPWDRMEVWVRGNILKGPLPIFLVSETLSMVIAPNLFSSGHLEPTGKYQPA